MLRISSSTSPKVISEHIAELRERKGKEREVLNVIDKALIYGNDFVINLFWEKALTFQHLVMKEDAKGDVKNALVRKRSLLSMEETVKQAKYFIVRYDLERWKHRLYRFLGRVADYKKDYRLASSYYRKSLKYARVDPEYLEKRYPRWLEIEAFLSFSILMSGQIGRGHTYAKRVYQKFDDEREAKYLKKTDYVTWAIWKSGIPIRTINALLNRKVTFDRKEALSWLDEAKKILTPKVNFEYRLDEVASLRKRLLED